MGDYQQEQQQGMNGGLELPPGFRFHPTDEEIITAYLVPKVLDNSFTAIAIGEVDLNQVEPWELPEKAKMQEKKELYFYCLKDRKYPTGTRTNRATDCGYWKATGKDKEIYRAAAAVPVLIGMKKTLVFYKGRAPKGEKTNWVMHEYRLDGSGRVTCPSSSSMRSSSSSREWVVCRVFQKSSGMKKVPAPSPYDMAMAGGGIDQGNMPMPPMPMPMHFPMGPEDFNSPLMDPMASFYSTAGASSSSMPPVLPPLAGMGSAVGLQMNGGLFGINPMLGAAQPMSFYGQQMGMGGAGDGGLMAGPESGPTSMVSHDAAMSPDQTNAADISSVISSCPAAAAAANMEMDGMWKY